MGTTTVTVAGKYRRVRWNSPSGTLRDDLTFDNSGSTFTETRPERVRTRKPPGWLMPKGYELSVSSVRYPTGERRLASSTGLITTYWSGQIPGVYSNHESMNLPTVPPGTQSLLETKALLKLKDTRINVGVALGEASSTARGLGQGWGQIQHVANRVGSGLSRIARSARALKRGKWKDAKRHLGLPPSGSVPKNWLALQYGWLPLLSDIKGATDELMGMPSHALIHTVKASWRDNFDKEVFQTLGSNHINKLTVRSTCGMFVRLDYEPSNSFLQTATRVGLTNPAEIAWELLPFSFVLDWALPIGDWLSALDASLGWDFKSGSVSTLRRNRTAINSFASFNRYSGSWEGSSVKLEFNRTVYGSSPIPYPPRLKNPVSLGHAANGLSLLATVFSGKK